LTGEQSRTIEVRLLGGLVVWATTVYRGPKRNGKQKRRGKEGAGIYPELGVLGIREGSSPALLEKVGRLTALLQSFEMARQELAVQGRDLDIKVVHRMAKQLGAELLTVRARDVELYRAKLVPQGNELAGKRVGVALDGGRVRTRKVVRKQKGKGKDKTQRRKMRIEWREPKLLIIFEMDRRGRMVAGSRPWIDGTLAGPDETMELLAMHLHRLGAAKAKTVTFLADGAPWIWERVLAVATHVGIASEKVTCVLDWCHAMHHVSLALAKLNLEESERQRLYKKYRKWIRAGTVLLVVSEIRNRPGVVEDKEGLETALNYLEKHAKAGHMNYGEFCRRGLPLGSGAIESAVRRVINLRLKGNGLLWEEENAEGMLVVRAAILCGRWEETQAEVRRRFASNRQTQLNASGTPISWQLQTQDTEADMNTAA
jgi:hypothetical protein